jgi:leucine dehydrogenase
VIKQVEKIYDRLLEIFAIADKENVSTQKAATIYAEKRINIMRSVQSNFIPR